MLNNIFVFIRLKDLEYWLTPFLFIEFFELKLYVTILTFFFFNRPLKIVIFTMDDV